MADEKEFGTPGAVTPAAQGQAEVTGAQAGAGQPETKPAVNLDEFEEFRKVKSSYDKQISAARNEAQEARRVAQELQNRFHQEKMQGMEEAERVAYENNLLRERMAQMERERQLELYAFRKEQDIREVAALKGLDYEDLVAALPQDADSFVLWKVADKMASSRPGTPATPSPAHQAANQVDLGQGRPPSATNKYEQMLADARKNKDVGAMLDAYAAAAADGIALE